MPHPSTSSAYGIWSLNEVRDAERGDNWPEVVLGWSLSSASYDSVSYDFSAQITSGIRSARFSTDGSVMFLLNLTNDSIYQYSLSTAFDITSATYSKNKSFASESLTPADFAFKPDGTKMYLVDYSNDAIYQYSLSTAFDIASASYDSVSLSVGSQESTAFGLTFNSNGTKLFVIGWSGFIYQYSLGTAYDLSTASYDSVSLDISSQDTTPVGVEISGNDDKLFVVGYNSDSIYEYVLSTPSDLSSASYSSVSFSFNSEDTNPFGAVFSADGTKMYMCGSTNYTLFQYSTVG
jgi:DNA-binding beta-propeller fold protein YncE